MSLMYCNNCKKMYGPSVPCPTCGVWGERVEFQPTLNKDAQKLVKHIAKPVIDTGLFSEELIEKTFGKDKDDEHDNQSR